MIKSMEFSHRYTENGLLPIAMRWTNGKLNGVWDEAIDRAEILMRKANTDEDIRAIDEWYFQCQEKMMAEFLSSPEYSSLIQDDLDNLIGEVG